MLGLMAAAEPVLQLGLLHMRPIQLWLKQRVPSVAWRHGRHHVTVTRACVSALAHWRDPFWLKQGVILDTAHRRKVVTTDTSNNGLWVLCEGKPTFGLWSDEEWGLHINCQEMLGVCQACQFFLPDFRGHHVLIRSDSRSVVSYINHQGDLVSKRLCTLANDLLVWAQNNLHSLKATHVPGKMNQGADMLSWNNVSSEEWTLWICRPFPSTLFAWNSGPNDSKVILKPRLGYVPKVLSTPFRAQVLALSVFFPPMGSQESLFCSVGALRIFIEHSASYSKSEQLFVGFGNNAKGGPVTKPRISRWLVDAITLAHSSSGLQCPIRVRAHSTRGIASSWAWSSGVSISDICEVAGWSSPSTFARFYLDVPVLQARVLSA